jgi:ATP-binding cassette subfamily A (ABC1) protein 3
MGLSSSIYWLTWFLKTLLYMAIAMLIYTFLMCVKLGSKGSVLANSDPTLIYVFLLCYTMATIAFCFMISTFFSKGRP